MSRKPPRVMEPVQAYLDATDADLLEEISERASLSKAEVIRRGIRRLAEDLNLARRPYASLSALTGVLDAAADVPSDLAARHDTYLYSGGKSKARRR